MIAFRGRLARHGEARKGNRAMADRLGLWRRGLHESMTELGRAGRENTRHGMLNIVLIRFKAIIIMRVAGRDGHQVVLVLTFEGGT